MADIYILDFNQYSVYIIVGLSVTFQHNVSCSNVPDMMLKRILPTNKNVLRIILRGGHTVFVNCAAAQGSSR